MTTKKEIVSSLEKIDYERPHRDDTRDLPCSLSPAEYQKAGIAFAKSVRLREALEVEAGQSQKAYKAKVETAVAEERCRLKIIETQSEERPVVVREFWAKENGQDVIVSVRIDKFYGVVDEQSYVGHRHAQPMDRQLSNKLGNTRSDMGVSSIERQANDALADDDAPYDAADDAPYDDAEGSPSDEDDADMVDMPGSQIEAKPKSKKNKTTKKVEKKRNKK